MGASAPCCSSETDQGPETVTVDLKSDSPLLAKEELPSPTPEQPAATEGPDGNAADKDSKVVETAPEVEEPAKVEETAKVEKPAQDSKPEKEAEAEEPEVLSPTRRHDKAKQTVLDLRRTSEVEMHNGKIKDFYTVFKPAIAEGAYGQVFKAETKDGKKEPRAVKGIPFDMVEDPEEFEKELAVAKLLKHPNIGYLHDTITDKEGRWWYLVTDLFSGGDLFDVMTDRGQKPCCIKESTLARYAYEMLDGIKYCHYHNFIHRDIKTENYMLEYYSDVAPLKLIDFGAACTFTPGVPLTQVVGTLAHAAPELLNGKYDEKADIWSIGITLYFLSVAKQPFIDPKGLEENLHKMIAAGPDLEKAFKSDKGAWSVVTNSSETQSSAADIIRKMCTLEPVMRPTARELLKSGDKYLAKKDKATYKNKQLGPIQEKKGFSLFGKKK